jgi:signal transduction histidine kinase
MLAFWRAASLDELLTRDFSDASLATRSRLKASMEQHALGRVLRESWTLYPAGHPMTSALLSRGIQLADGEQAILFCSEPLAASYDADMLRGIEALQHTPVRVALHSLADGTAAMRNPAAVAAFGSVDEAPGGAALDQVFCDPALADTVLADVRAGRGHAGQALMPTRQGPCWHAIDARSVRDPVSGHEMLLLNARDISDLKRALTDLETARDAAEAANRAKSRFLANMSHEIRTPMNGVLGLTSLVLTGALDERQRRYLQMAHDSALALMVVINDLLDLSKIEANKLKLHNAPVSLRDALRHALAPLAVQAAQRGLTLAWTVADDVPGTVLADGQRWGQVLLNLAGNALKFTAQGRVDVSLACAPDAGDGALRLRCSVVDTGIGMTPEQLAVVFDPFTQADDSITRRYGGTGLGLSIARRLVQLMDGQINASSQAGQGSCFQFVVPVGLPAPQ